MYKKLILTLLIGIFSQVAFSQSKRPNFKFTDPKNLVMKIDTIVFNKKFSPAMFYSEKHQVMLMAVLPEMSYAYAVQDMEKGIKEMGIQEIEKKSYKKGNNEITYLRGKTTKKGVEEINDTYIIKDPQGKVFNITSQIPLTNNEAVTKAVREAAESAKIKK